VSESPGVLRSAELAQVAHDSTPCAQVCDHYLAKGQGLGFGRASRLLFQLAVEVKGLAAPLRLEDDRERARVLDLEQLMQQ
jgi:hypothetical protein